MANNRMYLVCRQCNGKIMLGKIFSESYYTCCDDRKNFEDELNNFYAAHEFCHGENYIHPENQFELEYEIAHAEFKD